MPKKNLFVSLFALFSAALFAAQPLLAATAPELDSRILEAKRVLDDVMKSPDRSVPEEFLAKCKAIAIYPRTLKGAFIVGARFGRGVVLKKSETGEWGPVAFSSLGGGNVGLQIGGQATDYIFLIMNDNGLSSLLKDNFTLGVDASVAAGPVGRKSAAETDFFLKAGILSYSRSMGIFAGASVDGSVMTQDNNSNAVYYGKAVTSRDILLGNSVEAQPSSAPLRDALKEYAARWSETGSKHIYETTPQEKPDYEGEIESIDYSDKSVLLINMAPADQRKEGEAANLRVVLSAKDLASVHPKEVIQVFFEPSGKDKVAKSIVKVHGK